MEAEIVKAESAVSYFAATNSEEMARAQGGLTVWVESRFNQARMDRMEVERALSKAKSNKWNTSALQRQTAKATKLEHYYKKMLEALQAGYVLVPAFPIDVFAIRTAKIAPTSNDTYVKEGHDANSNSSIHSEILPTGEGEYKSDEAERRQRYDHTAKEKDYQGKEIERTIYHFFNEDFQDVAFPMIACKPHVMNAASEAMAKKIFDEMGISTQSAGQNSRAFRRGDPLIIGAIYGPGPRWSRKVCHFLISWHVNVADL